MHITIQPTDPDDPMALACLAQYFALLVARIPDLSPQMFPLPDPDARSYRPPSGTFLLALSGQTPVGCVSLRPLTPLLAEVKRLWIAPAARGQGVARRLMQTVEDHARTLGHTALTLDTNEHLPEAIALYTNTGWHLVPPYTDPPATHWFGKPL